MIYVIDLNQAGHQMVEEKVEIRIEHGIKLEGNIVVNLIRDRCLLICGSEFHNENLWDLRL